MTFYDMVSPEVRKEIDSLRELGMTDENINKLIQFAVSIPTPAPPAECWKGCEDPYCPYTH